MKKFVLCVMLVFVVACSVCLGVGLSYDYDKVDMVYINEVVQCLNNGTMPKKNVYDYTIVEKSGEVKFSTKQVDDMEYNTRLSKAYGEGDIVIDYEDSKIIFYLSSQERFYAMRGKLIWLIVISIIAVAISVFVCAYFVYVRTTKPFNKLRCFAQEVAKGNLDSPLILDKYNSFGAFGEAFDIMRNNLRESKISEQNEMLGKRRLIQEIGHEIKTPLSSIKAVAECGIALNKDKNYNIIWDKANVIDNMVNDFYQKALEEDGQLNVFVTKHSVVEFKQLIVNSDYNGKIVFGKEVECNILYDNNRMTQIVDNIIVNSYKYADTEIKVEMRIKEDRFEVIFKDYGAGVAAEQLSYIMDRFYRGEKTAEKLGQGLGLNICRKLILRMGGDMNCYNDNGFVVQLNVPVLKNYGN